MLHFPGKMVRSPSFGQCEPQKRPCFISGVGHQAAENQLIKLCQKPLSRRQALLLKQANCFSGYGELAMAEDLEELKAVFNQAETAIHFWENIIPLFCKNIT